ncbi:MAG: lysylphosphatidylglycerol synthase transmembrane domain-containing protein [Zestosphaera sp.]
MVAMRKALLLALAVALISYTILFLVMYLSDISFVYDILLRRKSLGYALLALTSRMASVTLHALTFYVLVKMFGGIALSDVLKITYISIFTELIVPIGGITEVTKFALLNRYTSLASSRTILGIASHRVVTTLTMTFFMVVALVGLHVSLPRAMILVMPAVALLIINVALLALPRSRKLESLVNRVLRTSGKRGELRFHEEYNNEFLKLATRHDLILLATSLSILERLANVLHGYSLSLLIGVSLNVWQLVLGFDSIYMIMWLLPVVTPGNVGIYELTQTGVLTLVGTDRGVAALLSVLTRVFIVLGEYPLFLLAMLSFGISLKSVLSYVEEAKKSYRLK